MIQNLAARFRGKKDAGFFSTTKKGEVVEWGEAIRSTDKNAKKDGIKRIIAAMTVGKDVSSLFGDVVKCMQASAGRGVLTAGRGRGHALRDFGSPRSGELILFCKRRGSVARGARYVAPVAPGGCRYRLAWGEPPELAR